MFWVYSSQPNVIFTLAKYTVLLMIDKWTVWANRKQRGVEFILSKYIALQIMSLD